MRFLPPHWGLARPKILMVHFQCCAWLCRANGTWSVADGRPTGLPYPSHERMASEYAVGAGPRPARLGHSDVSVGAAHRAAQNAGRSVSGPYRKTGEFPAFRRSGYQKPAGGEIPSALAPKNNLWYPDLHSISRSETERAGKKECFLLWSRPFSSTWTELW